MEVRVSDLAKGLLRLGWSRADGERCVRAAIAALSAERRSSMQRTGAARAGGHPPLDDAAVLLRAMKG